MAKSSPKVQSMTGYGRALAKNNHVSVDLEIKSVNSRYLDLIFKMPRSYNAFESDIRKVISDHLKRGRVEVFVQRSLLEAEEGMLSLQKPIFDAHLALFNVASGKKKGEVVSDEVVIDILNKRDVVLVNDSSEMVLKEKDLILEAVEKALANLVSSRQVEGKNLYADVVARFKNLKKLASTIRSKAEQEPASIKERILARLKDLSPELAIDEDRLATEAAYQADRVDITEELVRLDSHLAQCDSIFKESPHGKKLDFLLQECGREVNTIGSKTQSVEIKQCVLESKTELEKLREQAMNIE